MLAARRSLRASTAVAGAASRRRSVWWPCVTPAARRWLATSEGNCDGDKSGTAPNGRHETQAQKNKREFALLPTLLKTFEGATGHRVVPYHFFIPHADESIVTSAANIPTQVFGRVDSVREIAWPDASRGMNFGRVLEKFVRNLDHQRKHRAVARTLDEMGFPLTHSGRRQLAWDHQIMAALKTFYQIHGHSLVVRDFEVPRGDAQWPVATWGYNLGERVRNLRHSKIELSDSELADLKSVEFSFDVLDTKWSERILPSLETYASVDHNCRVPRSFEVPHEAPWPRKAWGLQLGDVVNKIRSQDHYVTQIKRDMGRLEAINFVWDDHEYQWGERVLPSLEMFHQTHGHCRVPKNFVVPSEAPWPIEAWGLQLGVSVNNIRFRGDFSQQTKRDTTRLEAIEFVWDVFDNKWNKVILPALETFAQVFRHCDVAKSFIVPSESPWPREAWGFNLGSCVSSIRSNRAYSEQTERDATRLKAIGFVWDHFEHMWNNVILPALETFAQVFRHCDVPTSFIVPSESPWPREAWGFNLGSCVSSIRSNRAYSEQTERDTTRLEAIGFVWDHLEHKWNNVILPALETFAQVFRHCDVPTSFIVPSESPWPREAWGFNLGSCVSSIRSNRAYSEQTERDATRLEAIGFVWDHLEHKWNNVILPALETFAQVFRHCDVAKSFIVPSESSWPREAWGFNLGLCVSNIRSNESYSKQTKRDAARLEAIGFVWDHFEHKWNKVILPALETFAQVFRHCDVAKSFIVPSESPWPREAWGFNLGSCVSSIRSNRAYSEQTERDATRLEAIGFVWDHFEHMWNNVILPALETFAQVFRHCDVPTSFIVPSESPWPREAWGINLGSCVSSIRSNRAYSEQTERDATRLEAIGFVWDHREHKWTNIILPSLKTFAQVFGHCAVPRSFVVPRDSPWPEEAWGLRLGDTVTNMRSRGDFQTQVQRDSRQLEAIDFMWNRRQNHRAKALLS